MEEFTVKDVVTERSKKIPVYEFDTYDSILLRVAMSFRTLPKYIYGFPETREGIILGGEIEIRDVLAMIEDDAKSEDFMIFLSKNKKYFTNLNIRQDVFFVWLAGNEVIPVLEEMNKEAIASFIETYIEHDYFENEDQFKTFFRGRDRLNKKLLDDISNVKKQNDSVTKFSKIIAELKEGVLFTEFRKERVSVQFQLPLTSMNILEIFNMIITNQSTPYATCGEYYKILKSFIPPDDFTPNTKILKRLDEGIEFISIKMNDRITPNLLKPTYLDVLVSSQGEFSKEIVQVNTRLNADKGMLDTNQFVDRLFTVIPPVNQFNLKETDVSGIFFLPGFFVNSYVLADLVMNNEIISMFLNIDESTKATKKKNADNTQTWIYIHFEHPSTGHISASVISKIVSMNDPELRKLSEVDQKMFKPGDPYVRVRAKGKDVEVIKHFQLIFSKLLGIYMEEYEKIVNEYKEYLPEFGTIVRYEEKKVKERKLERSIFEAGFTRMCSADRTTRVISDEEAEGYDPVKVMKFPREVAPYGQPSYDSDGVNPKNYVCDNPVNPYPGLIMNKTLVNREEYPFLPCCYASDRTQSEENMKYYQGVEFENINSKEMKGLIITDKIVYYNRMGKLPENLDKLLSVLDPDPAFEYVRMGVGKSPSSFLSAVLYCIQNEKGDDKNIHSQQTEHLQIEYTEEYRKGFLQDDQYILSKQHCFDQELSSVFENIENSHHYFDPKLYLQMVETVLGCQIFLFDYDGMITPRYEQGYYTRVNNNPCLLIYENWGSESDNAVFPQCEIIVKRNPKYPGIKKLFQPEDKLFDRVKSMFQALSACFIRNDLLLPINISFLDKFEISSQSLDSYGKCRRVVLRLEDYGLFPVFISPLPPFAVPVKEIGEDDEELTIPIVDALHYISEMGGKVISQQVSREKVTFVTFVVSNPDTHPVTCNIPVTGDVIPLIPFQEGVLFPRLLNTEQGDLNKFNRNKRIARYITEYLFWWFSSYLVEMKTEVITDKTLVEFSKNRIRIDRDYIYPMISKNFSRNGEVVKDGKFIVTSEEMLRRLMFVLKLYTMQGLPELREFYTRNSINKYYVDITDFDQNFGDIILKGKQSVEKWIYETKNVLRLYDSVQVGMSGPYFLRHSVLGDNVYLAQNCRTLMKALNVGETWGNQGYNTLGEGKEYKSQCTYTLYTTESNIKNVTKKVVFGTKPVKPVGVLMRRESETFVALLEL